MPIWFRFYRLLSRLTPPLCLNFLGLIHMDSHIIKKRILETQYTQVRSYSIDKNSICSSFTCIYLVKYFSNQIMGHMDVISIISNGFNIYFPMVMIIISIATYFNVGSHLLTAIGFPQYLADDEITEDIVTEGQRLALAGELHRTRVLCFDFSFDAYLFCLSSFRFRKRSAIAERVNID